MSEQKENWTEIIGANQGWLALRLGEVWQYRDLLVLLVRRDFVSFYKQTLLGPIWFFMQPLLTTLIYVIIFGVFARMSTEGVPPILFYLSGITLWNYFSDCLTKTAGVFVANANIFGKVYFPRLVIPLSIVISNLIKLGIQLVLLVGFWVFFYMQGASIHLNSTILLLPLLILIMAGIGLGMGMIFSALTTKYRDLSFMLAFGVQLVMYATPVIYPLSFIPEQYKWVLIANPMTGVIETFRHSFLGSGDFQWMYLGYSCVFTAVILFLGLIIFNRVQYTFMDTV